MFFGGNPCLAMEVLAVTMTDHFEELKRELDGFNGLFGEWKDQKWRALTSDKEAYQRTLAEEQETVEALKKQAAQLAQKKQSLSIGKN